MRQIPIALNIVPHRIAMLTKLKHELEQSKTFLTFGFIQSIGMALGMLVPLVVAKFFSADLFACFSLARMVGFFFIAILFSPFFIPFISRANQERAKTGKINKSFSVYIPFFGLGLAVFLILNLLLHNPIRVFAKISFSQFIAVVFAFLGISFQMLLTNLFMALNQRIRSALSDLVFGVSNLGLVLLLYFTGRITLEMVFYANFISSVIVLVLLIWSIDFNLLLPFSFERVYFRQIFNDSKWLMLNSAATYFIDWGGNFVLRPFAAMKSIGSYNLGYQIFKGINTLIAVISTYFIPFISSNIKNTQVIRNYLSNKRLKIFMLGLFGIALIFMLAPYILQLIYGQTYQQSSLVLGVLLFGCILILYNNFYIPIIIALKEYRFIVIVNIIQGLLNILISWILVPRINILGSAYSAIAAYLFTTTALEIYYRINLKKQIGL